MAGTKYAIGVDFGTPSGRAVLIDVTDGKDGRLRDVSYQPSAENKAIFDKLFVEYVTLHDYFGRGENNIMKRPKDLRAEIRVNALGMII